MAAMTMRSSWALTAIVFAWPACAADVSHYFESAASGKPRGDAGFVVSGDWLQLKADVALRTSSGTTEVVPNLRSTFDLGTRVGVETRVDLADRNSNGSSAGALVKTRLHYDPPPPFLETVDGSVWRAPDGQTGETLNIAFKTAIEVPGRQRPITIRGRAAMESTSFDVASDPTTVATLAEARRRYGFETEVRGLLRGLAGRKSALRLKIERLTGGRVETAKSLAYDYSWTVHDVAQLGLNFGMRRATQETIAVLEPSFGLTWQARF
jgi:hypothetical protein